MNKRCLILDCGILCLVAPYRFVPGGGKKVKNPTWSPCLHTGTRIWSQNCNWTFSSVLCSQKACGATRHRNSLHTIPAVCSTLVTYFLCPSLSSTPRHMTWWYSLVPKRKQTPPICYIWCPKSSIHAASKACPVVCVLELSGVLTVAWWDNINHRVSVCGFTECEWVSSCCNSYCCTKVGLYWPFHVWR